MEEEHMRNGLQRKEKMEERGLVSRDDSRKVVPVVRATASLFGELAYVFLFTLPAWNRCLRYSSSREDADERMDQILEAYTDAWEAYEHLGLKESEVSTVPFSTTIENETGWPESVDLIADIKRGDRGELELFVQLDQEVVEVAQPVQ